VKLGTENKQKTIVAGVLMVLAVGVFVYQFSGNSSDPSAPPPTASTSSGARGAHKARPLMAHSLDPTLRFDLLRSSEDVTYQGNGRNIFSSQAPPPPQPIPQPTDPALVNNQPPPPPPPPPSGLKFYGFANPKNGTKKVFLIKGEDIFLAKEGDVVDRRYKIVRVGPSSVDVQDVLTNHTETLPLSAG